MCLFTLQTGCITRQLVFKTVTGMPLEQARPASYAIPLVSLFELCKQQATLSNTHRVS